MLHGVCADLATAIDNVLRADGGALRAELDRKTDTELLAEAMLARIRNVALGRQPAARATPAARAAPAPAPARGLGSADGATLTLIVDSAERFAARGAASSSTIVEKLAARGVRCERRPLAVGDYCWIVSGLGASERAALARALSLGAAVAEALPHELMLKQLAERKTTSDLAASVRDGRYAEQKWRLQKARALGASAVAYLVEGSLAATAAGGRGGGGGGDGAERGWRERALPSAVAKTAAHSRFAVCHTLHINETVNVLAAAHAALDAQLRAGRTAALVARAPAGSGGCEADGAADDDQRGAPLGWAEFSARLAKRDDANARNVWGKMVLQVPAVSEKIAEALLGAYPTAAALRAALRAFGDDRAAAVAAIGALKLRDSPRRIGPVAAGRIHDAFR
jgi:crossover junction endonuclease MUS81